jgi:Cu+-exporting ATPase
MREREGQGATCVLLAVGSACVGALAIRDALKPEALGVVAALRAKGLACHMVTGDNWTTARIVAAQLGILNVQADVQPAGKAERVRTLGVPVLGVMPPS